MGLIGNMVYLKTTLESKHKRSYLSKYGFEKTVQKYPTLGGRKLLTANEINSIIFDGLCSNVPFMAGRFGSIELLVTGKKKLGVNYNENACLNELCNNAGFFPNEPKLLNEFSKLMQDSMAICDVQGVWYLPFEDYFLKNGIPNYTQITEGRYLEPWFSTTPWTRALEEKKVLVIHPFAQSIKYQYDNCRDKLFPTRDLLPEFDLLTMKAVQTIAGQKDDRFNTWFDALEYIYEEAMKMNFDIAILGCGAYGYPLAAKIKKAGKKAVHMGGVTQAMFGIKGKRWEEDSVSIVRDLYNENWIRPSKAEAPQQKNKVEGGCYW